MAEYQIEIKQLVDYPRCRMYRALIRRLMADTEIRVGKRFGLYHYIALCCFTSFRTSYEIRRRVKYDVYPGDWICNLRELTEWLRTCSKKLILTILDEMQSRELIKYRLIGRGDLVKYRIRGWTQSNRAIEYNAPCQKDSGFFFVPMDVASENVETTWYSEMDVLLDLLMNTVYNEPKVKGSYVSPVVYIQHRQSTDG